MNDKELNSYKNQLLYIIIGIFLLFLLFFSIAYLIEKNSVDVKMESIIENENRLIIIEKEFIKNNFGSALADLSYLEGIFNNEIRDHFDFKHIEDNWLEFIKSEDLYDQIRFIDKDGYERIRVNKLVNGGEIVDGNKLQYKGERYYFKKTINLSEKSIYVSPLDLNVENDKIEIPYKPMIRFSKPVYDNNSNLIGIIIINYLADRLLEDFESLTYTSEGKIYLINQGGDWLYSGDEKIDFNFMFEEKKEKSFSKENLNLWNDIKLGKNFIRTENNIYNIMPILLNNEVTKDASFTYDNVIVDDRIWYIISNFSENENNKILFANSFVKFSKLVLLSNKVYFLITCIIALIIGYLIYYRRKIYINIRYHSEYDKLTGVYNRRKGLNILENILSKSNRRKVNISLCFIDINDLKIVNDNFGHEMGDELLITVSEVIKNEIREEDYIMRLGGDEFLIVFRNTNLKDSEKVWFRINSVFDSINKNEDRPYLISVSHGFSTHSLGEDSKVDHLINLADKRMYQEKKKMKENINVIKNNNYI